MLFLMRNIVSLQPVKNLIALQEDASLKVAHKLKAVLVNPGQLSCAVTSEWSSKVPDESFIRYVQEDE